ncbi:MAG TPA: VOC family protein [Megamonas hypermegale]|uniref:VOC family protein n=1 Tax=Megamonas hypermegale TaxID=158847 RepID=A0A921HNG9_9FIRM|nr:VOC family protein [Megamonas hypermegale]HJF84872.1 VOC family protein [Megamonas hypermegale]
MKIDHVAMYVWDLEGAKEFFVRFFQAKPNDMYHNPKTGLKTYFLSFDDGSRLEIMNRPDMKEKPLDIFYQGLIHLSFKLGSKEKVDELTKKLHEAGYEVLSGPRVTGDGYYESCILAFENNLLELVA